uniref:MADS box containing protein PI n=1 Tax=Sagittaria montevidensis TaxID=118780 RepID=Q9LL93_SAGMO|nr:MADS box containing protein PI [Sagittaria montevidensis]
MGRGKIEIKRIENSANRQVTYSKRRNGIIKKAREISVLCGCEVSLVIFSSSGKMSEFHSTTLSKILETFQQNQGQTLWGAKHESLKAEIDRMKKENDNMRIQLRHMKGEDLTSMEPRDLYTIETALINGIANVRGKQMEIFKKKAKNQKALEEENKQLAYILHQQSLAMNGNLREMPQDYHQKDRDFTAPVPFGFRVQPMQPNLQENK